MCAWMATTVADPGAEETRARKFRLQRLSILLEARGPAPRCVRCERTRSRRCTRATPTTYLVLDLSRALDGACRSALSQYARSGRARQSLARERRGKPTSAAVRPWRAGLTLSCADDRPICAFGP